MDFESGRNAGPSAYLPVEVRAGAGCRHAPAEPRGTRPARLTAPLTFPAPPLASLASSLHPPTRQVLLAKLEALTGAEAAARSQQQYAEMYR